MKTEYRQLKEGEKIEKGDLILKFGVWDDVWFHEIGKPVKNTMIVKRVAFHKPILTELALHLIGESKHIGLIRKFIQREQTCISYYKITLTDFAVDLLERKYREIRAEKVIREHIHTNTTPVMPHAFPQRKVRQIGESTSKVDFDRAERDYHGYEKPLEIATGGHRLRGLDFLIKSRS